MLSPPQPCLVCQDDSKKDFIEIQPTPLVTPPTMDDPGLKSTWSHRAWFTTGGTTVLLSLANAIYGSINSCTWLETIVGAFIGYVFADLGSGVYHWVIDNYGDAATPIFGFQIDAFQHHHKWPSVITKLEFANSVHRAARTITFLVLPIDLIWHDQPVVMGFMAMASGCALFSVKIHAWAHVTKSKLPPIVAALQDAGVLISQSQHATHHRRPYNNSYCVVSGVWNGFLDKHRVFEALETMVYFQLGLRPRSWSEPNYDCTEEMGAS